MDNHKTGAPEKATERLRLFALHGTEALAEKIASLVGCGSR